MDSFLPGAAAAGVNKVNRCCACPDGRRGGLTAPASPLEDLQPYSHVGRRFV